MAHKDPDVLLFNKGIGIVPIFYRLYLIKKENRHYKQEILFRNKELQQAMKELMQKNLITSRKDREQAIQTDERTSLNTVKPKPVSILAHEHKVPILALRNIFQQMQQHFDAD